MNQRPRRPTSLFVEEMSSFLVQNTLLSSSLPHNLSCLRKVSKDSHPATNPHLPLSWYIQDELQNLDFPFYIPQVYCESTHQEISHVFLDQPHTLKVPQGAFFFESAMHCPRIFHSSAVPLQ